MNELERELQIELNFELWSLAECKWRYSCMECSCENWKLAKHITQLYLFIHVNNNFCYFANRYSMFKISHPSYSFQLHSNAYNEQQLIIENFGLKEIARFNSQRMFLRPYCDAIYREVGTHGPVRHKWRWSVLWRHLWGTLDSRFLAHGLVALQWISRTLWEPSRHINCRLDDWQGITYFHLEMLIRVW